MLHLSWWNIVLNGKEGLYIIYLDSKISFFLLLCTCIIIHKSKCCLLHLSLSILVLSLDCKWVKLVNIFFMKYIVKISWLQKIRTNNYCSYTKRLKPQRRRLNAQDSGKAISMLQTGMSQNAVGRLINRPQSVIDVTVVGKVLGNRISPGKTSK